MENKSFTQGYIESQWQKNLLTSEFYINYNMILSHEFVLFLN